MALSASRGQAEAFYLSDTSGSKWILKKFHKGRELDFSYLSKIGTLVPKIKGTEAATTRRVLRPTSLTDLAGASASNKRDLAAWLDSTVLMQQIPGCAWCELADDLRFGRQSLQRGQRLRFAASLCNIVRALVLARCSHRDLSSGNVFVDLADESVYLIDWDTLFHPSLPMPSNTMAGTPGYIAPFIPRQGQVWDGRASWCGSADEFALAVLIVEFLAAGPGLPSTGDGGLFEQSELERRAGAGIDKILSTIDGEFPTAKKLFLRALQADKFEQMSIS
jgi:serine/threonine protein kinase